MNFDVRKMDERQIEAAAWHYEHHGFFLLDGLEDSVTALFPPVLTEMIGVSDETFTDILDPEKPIDLFPVEVRQRLARIETSPQLAQGLLTALEPVLTRLIGPLVHVSSTFHGQFKGGAVKAVDHGGYTSDFLEVHGAYLLHQDFACANIPTSPSGVTLWIGMNDCPDWNLRLYPGSHRHGLLCNRWPALDEPGLAPFGAYIDVPAKPGQAIVFNAMLLHGTSNAGPLRRVSCDIRFFPLTGFLPSKTHWLGANPAATLQQNLDRAIGPTLQAPLLEDLAFLGEAVDLSHVPPHSIFNWVSYISHVLRGEMDAALPYLVRFVNEEIGFDPPEKFVARFHGKPVYPATLQAARERFAQSSLAATVAAPVGD